MTGHGTLIIVSVYLPPKKRLFWSDIETLLALGDAVILFGDLNSKNTDSHCSTTNASRRTLATHAEDHRLTYITDQKYSILRIKSHRRSYQTQQIIQRKVKACVREVKNDNWSNLMEKINPTYKAYWAVAKALDDQEKPEPNHSCTQQALQLVEHISEGFKCKSKTVAVFFDVAKAFDKVRHAGVIYKLHQSQVPDHLIFIIHQYLMNRHFSFRHENSTFGKRLIRAGVPQGSTLFPLLYSAYTNDIPRPQTGVQLALFVDDTAFYLRGSNFREITPRLQKAINELTHWF
ncbi:Probable RNA-directed DNA polymerase from transposon BS [Eumeta japonica]|uniref:Probable RNA-directed DNA polymerase from transposon BS n=1 Tax=Eumeta variegata TaxID=151549 RepID=A0A4C1VAE7_EUMVA|nr:Probable RNA-directed DNA polymerase from transposon BS [Eumeta japonica]